MGVGREGQYHFTYLPLNPGQHPSFLGGMGRGSSLPAPQPVFKRNMKGTVEIKKIV